MQWFKWWRIFGAGRSFVHGITTDPDLEVFFWIDYCCGARREDRSTSPHSACEALLAVPLCMPLAFPPIVTLESWHMLH